MDAHLYVFKWCNAQICDQIIILVVMLSSAGKDCLVVVTKGRTKVERQSLPVPDKPPCPTVPTDMSTDRVISDRNSSRQRNTR